MKPQALKILRLDSGGGLAVGTTVLALHSWLAALYGLSVRTVVLMGIANLAYGCYSGVLIFRTMNSGVLPRLGLDGLIAANFAWVFVCAGLVAENSSTLTWLGVASFAVEMAVVGGLAVAEVRVVRPETTPWPATPQPTLPPTSDQ